MTATAPILPRRVHQSRRCLFVNVRARRADVVADVVAPATTSLRPPSRPTPDCPPARGPFSREYVPLNAAIVLPTRKHADHCSLLCAPLQEKPRPAAAPLCRSKGSRESRARSTRSFRPLRQLPELSVLLPLGDATSDTLRGTSGHYVALDDTRRHPPEQRRQNTIHRGGETRNHGPSGRLHLARQLQRSLSSDRQWSCRAGGPLLGGRAHRAPGKLTARETSRRRQPPRFSGIRKGPGPRGRTGVLTVRAPRDPHH